MNISTEHNSVTLEFTSHPAFFPKEYARLKRNVIVYPNKLEKELLEVICDSKVHKDVRIKNYGSDLSFKETITDISFYNDICIISW